MTAFLSFCRPWQSPYLPDSLELEHSHCASRDYLVHCANALPLSLARWVISIDGSGGNDGAPASWAVIAIANDGHLQFKPYRVFLQDWFLDLSNFRVLALLVAILLVRKALRLLGLCCGSWPTLVDYQS